MKVNINLLGAALQGQICHVSKWFSPKWGALPVPTAQETQKLYSIRQCGNYLCFEIITALEESGVVHGAVLLSHAGAGMGKVAPSAVWGERHLHSLKISRKKMVSERFPRGEVNDSVFSDVKTEWICAVKLKTIFKRALKKLRILTQLIQTIIYKTSWK